MSTTLVIIVAAIVILITALVVVTIFGGGMQNFLGVLNPWSSSTTAVAQCQGICQQLCLTHTGTGEPSTYSGYTITKDGGTTTCGAVLPGCDCADFQIGLTCASYNNNEAGCKAKTGCTWTGTAGATAGQGTCS